MHAPVDGISLGQHPLVCRLLKGAFHVRPPLPHYSRTWDFSTVLTYPNDHNLQDNSISLRLLILLTVMLLALTRLLRLADLLS